MSIHQHGTLEDTIYLWFAANDTSGSGGDGANAAAHVRLAGAAAGAIPVLSPTPTLLSHANYPAGCYEIAVAATDGNGFAAGNTYAVFCTLAIDSQNPSGFVGAFTLGPMVADMTHIHGSALTETSGQLAAAFVKLFDVATPLLVTSDVMRGTDGANTTIPDVAGTAPTAVESRQEMDSNSTELAKIGTIPALDGAGQTIGAAIAKLADDNGGADFDAETDSLTQIRLDGDSNWFTAADINVVAWNGVTLDTTNPLPNAEPDAAGGLPISDAGALDLDQMDSNISDILTDTGTTLPALIAALNNLSSANVQTAVDAALDTAIAELGVAAPAVTPTLRTGLMLLYMALRNKTDSQTSGTDALEIHNDAGTLICQKLLTDAGGDYSEAKMTSG